MHRRPFEGRHLVSYESRIYEPEDENSLSEVIY